MKKISFYIAKILLFVIILINASSCTEDFEEINTPTDSSITTDAKYLFASAQLGIRYECGEYQNNVIGCWTQQWCGGPLFSPSLYIPENFSRQWNSYYGYLKNLGLIRNDLLNGLEDAPEGRTELAMAKILEIYYWQILTDLYGPVPYTESILPAAELIKQPVYDSQESIYKSLIDELDIAISKLTSGDVSYGSSDMFYSGDVELWKKFGNSLRLKLGMRLKYVDSALSKATVEKALSGSLIGSNSENADLPTYSERYGTKHSILQQYEQGSSDYFYLAEKFVDVLVEKNDPRMPLLGDLPSVGDTYKGVKVAQTDEYYSSIIRLQYSQVSSITYFNEERTIPLHVLSYGEVSFFKAEAALEGWGGLSDEDAELFYQEGIKAAMSMEPYNIAEVPADYIASEFSLDGLSKEEKLEKIMVQKWILLFGRNNEAWAEWRRTGYPVLTPGPSGEGEIPRRLIYPVSETAYNRDSYNAAVATLSKGDAYQSKVWWDKK